MKIFISQPMRGKSEEFIIQERKNAVSKLKELYPDVEIIDSYHKGYLEELETKDPISTPIKYLAASIHMLADAKLVVFLSGWEEARGCLIEKRVAERYGIETMIMNP